MRESSLWSWLERGGRAMRPGLHMTRVEDLLAVGRPDVEACLEGRSFVCELKVAARPRRTTTPIRTQSPITPEQVGWLRARRDAGGQAWLLVQVGERHEALRYLLAAEDVTREVALGVVEEQLAELSWTVPWVAADVLIGSMAYATHRGVT